MLGAIGLRSRSPTTGWIRFGLFGSIVIMIHFHHGRLVRSSPFCWTGVCCRCRRHCCHCRCRCQLLIGWRRVRILRRTTNSIRIRTCKRQRTFPLLLQHHFIILHQILLLQNNHVPLLKFSTLGKNQHRRAPPRQPLPSLWYRHAAAISPSSWDWPRRWNYNAAATRGCSLPPWYPRRGVWHRYPIRWDDPRYRIGQIFVRSGGLPQVCRIVRGRLGGRDVLRGVWVCWSDCWRGRAVPRRGCRERVVVWWIQWWIWCSMRSCLLLLGWYQHLMETKQKWFLTNFEKDFSFVKAYVKRKREQYCQNKVCWPKYFTEWFTVWFSLVKLIL